MTFQTRAHVDINKVAFLPTSASIKLLKYARENTNSMDRDAARVRTTAREVGASHQGAQKLTHVQTLMGQCRTNSMRTYPLLRIDDC